jgi:hypothetical protein
MYMRRLVPVVLLMIILSAAYFEASGWGSSTHKFINRKTVYHLPNSMQLFIQDSLYFDQHAPDADTRRTDDTAFFSEQWRHYLDIDDYPNFHNMPRNLDTLIQQYGWLRVRENGTNPWAAIWFYDSLVVQLRRADWPKAKQTAADIGHYVGDAHQPLHVTKNYNGQLTGQSGIHSRYETTMLSTTYFANALAITPDSVHYIANRQAYIFDYLLHSNSHVDSVLQADLYAKSLSGGSFNATYYNALWNKTRRLTLEQVQAATQAIASFWYTAWVDAGLISSTGILPAVQTTPQHFGLAQNYPNPFNPSTTISYLLPVGGTVSLKVYSLDGKIVATLAEGNESVGEHTVQFVAPAGLASGTYLYQLRLGNFSQTKKFVLLK